MKITKTETFSLSTTSIEWDALIQKVLHKIGPDWFEDNAFGVDVHCAEEWGGDVIYEFVDQFLEECGLKVIYEDEE